MDYKEEMYNSQKIESILKFTKGGKLIMEVDSNSRSTMWNDKITNPRGKKIEEFVASHHLHVINEKSERTTSEHQTKKQYRPNYNQESDANRRKKLGHIRGRKRLGSQHNKVQH